MRTNEHFNTSNTIPELGATPTDNTQTNQLTTSNPTHSDLSDTTTQIPSIAFYSPPSATSLVDTDVIHLDKLRTSDAKEGEGWVCPVCLFTNHLEDKGCVMCGSSSTSIGKI